VRRQGMAVVWVSGEAAGADHEAAVKGGGEADLGAKLATDAGLALGDAVDLGLVQGVAWRGVDLVLALRACSSRRPTRQSASSAFSRSAPSGVSCKWRRRSRQILPVKPLNWRRALPMRVNCRAWA
jgi:hypothetical protein